MRFLRELHVLRHVFKDTTRSITAKYIRKYYYNAHTFNKLNFEESVLFKYYVTTEKHFFHLCTLLIQHNS